MSDETVEIRRDALEQLAAFVASHGDEYGTPSTYKAAMLARHALGFEDVDPYMVWDKSWGEKPDLSDLTNKEESA